MFTPALPSLAANRPSAPGASVRVTARTSSSVAFQPLAANTFLAAAVLSTTNQIIPWSPCFAPANPTMFTFLAPSAVAISPSVPGRSWTVTVSCLALGIPHPPERESPNFEPSVAHVRTARKSGSGRCERLRPDANAQRHQHGAQRGVERAVDRCATQPPAHLLDSDRVAHEPGQRQQAEVQPQGEQQNEARVRPRKRGQQADEEGDHLRV